jgi:cyclopropane fatty-acyl-phospholipid synthase-like methyltransferase
MTTASEIARAFQVSERLLPHVPELLADLWSLGSWFEAITDLLRPLALPAERTRVLDLGCGKGGAGIPLARDLGFRVVGIDFFEPFVQEARRRAAQHGVAHRCRFELADMREAVSRLRDFDVVVYASVGSVLGNLKGSVEQLRRTVRAGGYMVIDDGFLEGEEGIDREGYGHYVTHAEAVRQLAASGDSMVREVLIPANEVAALDRRYIDLIRRRADSIAQRHPELADELGAHVEWQEEESRIFEANVQSAVWLLQRA